METLKKSGKNLFFSVLVFETSARLRFVFFFFAVTYGIFNLRSPFVSIRSYR